MKTTAYQSSIAKLDFDARMERRAARRDADPELQARLAAIQESLAAQIRAELDRARMFRYLEIWSAIVEAQNREEHASAFNSLPFEIRMRTGCVAL
jgi:hypothetical protein